MSELLADTKSAEVYCSASVSSATGMMRNFGRTLIGRPSTPFCARIAARPTPRLATLITVPGPVVRLACVPR
jgi:hypothetical protein